MDTQQPDLLADPPRNGEGDHPEPSARDGGGAEAERPSPAPSPEPKHVTITTNDFAFLRDSKALSAFVIRRMEQLTRYGHSPSKDLQLPLHTLPREAYGRVQASLDHIGWDGAHSAEKLNHALRNIEIAGALLLAAHDRISAEIAKAELRA